MVDPPGPPWGMPPPPTLPPPGPTPPPPGPTVPPRRTEPFAIVSLACSIGGLAFCGVPVVVGIVFGHLARGRIRRSGDDGAGLALAGLIVGYVGLALLVVAAAVVAIIIGFVASNADRDAASDARRLEHQIVELANARGQTPRHAQLITRVLRDSSDPSWVRGDVTVGSTGLDAVGASDAELEAAGWGLTINGDFGGQACLTVPEVAITREADVTEGGCGDGY